MPRISPKALIRARATSKALLSLLPVCRDLASANSELRWLQEYAINVSQRTAAPNHERFLKDLVARRARGEPLQYILGSEYFGNLEIRCRPGVLIPRQETAASVSYLVRLLKRVSCPALGVLDLCTGTGCIPLLFHDEFYHSDRAGTQLELIGVDVSDQALRLARENLIHQIAQQAILSNNSNNYRIEAPWGDSNNHRTKALQSIGFIKADILRPNRDPRSLAQALAHLPSNSAIPTFNILISNPPYISPKTYNHTTSRSVRTYEPKLALVPTPPTSLPNHQSDIATGDIFYPRLLQIAEDVGAEVLLLEVADTEQAKRVAGMAAEQDVWEHVEIWRDDPAAVDCDEEVLPGDRAVNVRGVGHGRSVFAYRGHATSWFAEM